jgi:hypothetical protein
LLGTGATVLLDVGLDCLFSVASGMNDVARRDVSMVSGCFMASSLVMLGGFLVMPRRMRKVFRDLFVMSCSLLRHEIFSGLNDCRPTSSIVSTQEITRRSHARRLAGACSPVFRTQSCGHAARYCRTGQLYRNYRVSRSKAGVHIVKPE